MKSLETLLSYAGTWVGLNSLWLTPDEPADDSAATAEVTPLLGGMFARLDYTWAVKGEAQAGSFLFGCETRTGLLSAVWIDSWHNGERMMVCKGSLEANGALDVLGAYPAPPDPDWGWRTRFEPVDRQSFRLLMYNITPQGQAMLAVEARFVRSEASGA